MANQVQNQPTAAYWLSLIGGILAVLGSLAFLVWGALALSVDSSISDYSGYYGDYSTGALGLAGGVLLGIGAWMLISSILVIVFARKLKANPVEHSKWGALILIFSIIGSWSILNLIGGILALTYKPIPVGTIPPQYAAPPPQQPYYGPPPQQAAYAPPPQTRICSQCGTQVQANVRFCPNCGRQQY